MDEKIFSAKDMYDALAFKQKLCKTELKEKNSCRFRYNCHFAHSFDEIQFNKNLAQKVNRYIHEKMAEHKVKNKREEKKINDEEFNNNKIKKLKEDLEDINYINKIILKSNNEMEKMIYDFKNDNNTKKSLEELEKNSNEIKNTFKKYDSRNDSILIIKRVRESSESPVDNKRRRSISSLNDDLDEYTQKRD